MFSTFRLVLSATILAAGLVAVATPAGADTPGCVTRSEFRSVYRGMSKTRVQAIFDTDGTRQAISWSGGFAAEVRSYRACSLYSVVSIAYDKRPGGVFRLSAKSAVWSG